MSKKGWTYHTLFGDWRNRADEIRVEIGDNGHGFREFWLFGYDEDFESKICVLASREELLKAAALLIEIAGPEPK